MDKHHPLASLLQETSISHLIKETGKIQLYSICQDAKLEDALKMMAERGVLSLPVKLEEHSLDYVGFIDVMDILNLIIQTCTEGNNMEEAQWSSWCQDIHTLSHRGIRFGLKHVKAIMDASGADPWTPVSPAGTLAQLIEVFARGVHRVAVVDTDGAVTSIVSQSDMVRFISNHITHAAPFTKTVKELGLGNRNVIDMSSSAQVIQAFYLMWVNKVSAVAVVGNDGELIANLSASDVRGLRAENFTHLLMPVTKYLLTQHSWKPPVTVSLNSTLEAVLLKLAWFRLHRVWIIDEANKPIGVISLTDVLNVFNAAD